MINLRSEHRCFNGSLRFYSHNSLSCQGPMNFAVFLPSKTLKQPCPMVYYLSGLTCTDENFIMKAGAQRIAEELGIILVAPDTSPRDRGIKGEKSGGRPGEGASYYINATKAPWSAYYQMFDYIADELPNLIDTNFPTQKEQRAIMGHSMGGHGAMMIGLRKPERFKSISALAPVCSPIQSPLAQEAFYGLLGENKAEWAAYDTVEILKKNGCKTKILIDQGEADEYLPHNLKLQELSTVVKNQNLPIDIRIHKGYDHSYYFVSSFIEDHLRFHHRYFEQNYHSYN